jgi:hypothetical protein
MPKNIDFFSNFQLQRHAINNSAANFKNTHWIFFRNIQDSLSKRARKQAALSYNFFHYLFYFFTFHKTYIFL